MKGAIIVLLLTLTWASYALTFGENIKNEPCFIKSDLGIEGNIDENYSYDYDSVPETMMWNDVNGTNY